MASEVYNFSGFSVSRAQIYARWVCCSYNMLALIMRARKALFRRHFDANFGRISVCRAKHKLCPLSSYHANRCFALCTLYSHFSSPCPFQYFQKLSRCALRLSSPTLFLQFFYLFQFRFGLGEILYSQVRHLVFYFFLYFAHFFLFHPLL